VVVFQYNPDTMTRKLDARTTGGGDSNDRSEALRLMGPPKETITLNIEVDATDQLEKAFPSAVASGVYPTLLRWKCSLPEDGHGNCKHSIGARRQH